MEPIPDRRSYIDSLTGTLKSLHRSGAVLDTLWWPQRLCGTSDGFVYCVHCTTYTAAVLFTVI